MSGPSSVKKIQTLKQGTETSVFHQINSKERAAILSEGSRKPNDIRKNLGTVEARKFIAQTGHPTKGSGLLGSKPKIPALSASRTRAAGSDTPRGTVDSMEKWIVTKVGAEVKRILGKDLSALELGGSLAFTITFQPGWGVKVNISENSLRIPSEKMDEVVRAVETAGRDLVSPPADYDSRSCTYILQIAKEGINLKPGDR